MNKSSPKPSTMETTLPEIFNLTPHINLTYKQNNFIISFAALGHTLADQIVYRYRMTNYEKELQMIPHSINKAYYSNLPYGNYKFELQVSTDRGFTWITPGREISFSISPPWWLTGWAKLLYVLTSCPFLPLLSINIIKNKS